MQEELNKFNIINQEIILDPTREIMSKTDKDGIIEFVNDYFVEVSGYQEYELLGKTMHCTQHPDMPNIIFKRMWEHLLTKQNFNVLVKNLSKDGKFYWAISDFGFKEDEKGNLLAIYNRRKTATPQTIRYFDNLYKKLKNIEEESGYIYAEKYLIGHEEEKGKSIEEILFDFQSNLSSPTKKTAMEKKIETHPMQKVKIKPKENTIIDLTVNETIQNKKEVSTENLSIKERLARLKDIHEKTLEALEVKPKETKKSTIDEGLIDQSNLNKENIEKSVEPIQKKKKGLFQKLFGKTEEELEEEERRRKNN